MYPWLDRIRGLFRARPEIYEDAYEGRQFDAVYFIMLVLACLIALLGLLLNSPAVIIGAMLISPLMGPILSCGLALTMADWGLGRKAARNVAFSVVETILIAILATFLSPLKDATPEILARTNPNLMDLLIAFFSGAAGTLALCSRKGGLTILPGVAIATAVMPPLATTGYGVSTGQWGVASGAFMLFFTNLTAIIISADIVFLLVGFRPERVVDAREHSTLVRGRFVIAGTVLILLSIPLIRTLTQAAQQANFRKEVEAVLAEQMHGTSERKLDRVSLELRDRELSVQAAVETPKFIEPEEIKAWEAAIHTRVGRPVRLELQQLQLARKESGEKPRAAPNRDYLGGGAIRPPGPSEQHASVASDLQNVQTRIQTSLSDLLGPLNAQAVSVRSVGARPDNSVAIEVDARVPQPITVEEWQVVAAAISRELHSSLQLTGNLAIGDPIQLRFRPRSLRLKSDDRRNLTQFLLRWNKQPDLSYRLVAADSAAPALSKKRIALLRKRSEKMSVGDASDGYPKQDTIVLYAVQRRSASVLRANPPGALETAGNKAD
jgi:uncharacterized hydrophobic protein (TIGR00271 family)